MGLEAVVLAKRPRVEQQLDPLPCGELSLGVLALDARLPTPEERAARALLEILDLLLDRQG
jgi:hypothetical protein